MTRLVLVRHGQSVGNDEHQFSGWTDLGLTPKGIEESRRCGRLLAGAGYEFDTCFTSVLSRSVDAGRLILDAMGQTELPLTRSWRLNERHFGALQGLNRSQGVRKFGLLKIWRLQRSYSIAPPALEEEDPRSPRVDPLYTQTPVAGKDLPLCESLEDTYARVIPYWESAIAPGLREGRRIVIAAHKNSLRALIKHIEGLSDRDAVRLQIVTGQPIVYRMDSGLRAVERLSIGKPARKFARFTGISPA